MIFPLVGRFPRNVVCSYFAPFLLLLLVSLFVDMSHGPDPLIVVDPCKDSRLFEIRREFGDDITGHGR